MSKVFGHLPQFVIVFLLLTFNMAHGYETTLPAIDVTWNGGYFIKNKQDKISISSGYPLILSHRGSAETNFTPSYQWTLNNKAIAGATSTVLEIPAITTEQAGDYRIQLVNNQGRKVKSPKTIVNVVAPPKCNYIETKSTNQSNNVPYVAHHFQFESLTSVPNAILAKLPTTIAFDDFNSSSHYNSYNGGKFSAWLQKPASGEYYCVCADGYNFNMAFAPNSIPECIRSVQNQPSGHDLHLMASKINIAQKGTQIKDKSAFVSAFYNNKTRKVWVHVAGYRLQEPTGKINPYGTHSIEISPNTTGSINIGSIFFPKEMYAPPPEHLIYKKIYQAGELSPYDYRDLYRAANRRDTRVDFTLTCAADRRCQLDTQFVTIDGSNLATEVTRNQFVIPQD